MNRNEVCKKIKAHLRKNNRLIEIREDAELKEMLEPNQLFLLPTFCARTFGIGLLEERWHDELTFNGLIDLIMERLSELGLYKSSSPSA